MLFRSNEEFEQSSGPVRLGRTISWACHKSRSVELGEFELRPGRNQITVRSESNSGLRIYSLWLVRLPSSQPSEPGSFTLDNFSSSANQITLDARADRDGFLLLNEVHYPGWEAPVDGKPAEIPRADTLFRALVLPAGSHRIEMRFRPRYFAWGAAVSLFTLFGFLVLVGSQWRKRASSRLGG